MGVFKNCLGLGSPYILQLLILRFIGLLGCLSCVALALNEASETVTNSVNFPDVGITCIGNLAIFITSLLRGRLDLELAARDILATVRGPKLKPIHKFGLTTCEKYKYEEASVVLLSFQSPNSSIEQFMRYISSAHDVQSILLECLPLKSVALLAEICNCDDECKCIVFCTVEEVTVKLAGRMPGILKRLTDTLCLLISRDCLQKGCHGCNQGMLYGKKLQDDAVERSSILETLDYIYRESAAEERTCICIPLNPAYNDQWTDLMIGLFRSKDKDTRGVRVMASDALENYMALGKEENYMSSDIVEARGIEVRYSQGSLIVPRSIEILLNLAVTGWFRTDGFSASLLVRRAIRNYLVDTKGNGFAANAFITKARVKSSQVQSRSDNNTGHEEMSVCQVLTFKGSHRTLKTLSFIGGFVNLVCSIGWAVLVAIEGGAVFKWHYTQSMAPSKARVAVIMAAIAFSLCMDFLHLFLRGFHKWYPLNRGNHKEICTYVSETSEATKTVRILMVCIVMFLEILGIVLCCTVLAGDWGRKKTCGRWIYSALHGLVWIKWAIGSYLLGERLPKHESGPVMTTTEFEKCVAQKRKPRWTDNGILVYSSAFFLNAILAGVRGKWDYIASDDKD